MDCHTQAITVRTIRQCSARLESKQQMVLQLVAAQRSRMDLMNRSLGISMTVLNIVGSMFYLLLAAPSWRDASSREIFPLTGEPFIWARCLPILVSLLLIDICWTVCLIISAKVRNWPAYSVSVTTTIVAIAIYFNHH